MVRISLLSTDTRRFRSNSLVPERFRPEDQPLFQPVGGCRQIQLEAQPPKPSAAYPGKHQAAVVRSNVEMASARRSGEVLVTARADSATSVTLPPE